MAQYVFTMNRVGKVVARLTKMYLEAEGYTVTVIDNGQNALETIKELKPDLVII